ncbi:uncharacterized protein SCDLUD_002170 [Saccharomycodes ludwigii]|uniref:uncharacterized protein n=1 Tax=Saccharomycodes ludwigii TaxID=36035 RepID=UPI001E831D47|nr:hypothetical protein SCDLUD_002170 [Saccharomycodes ludwigii]KAH3902350.1 hypothetical protein SCDLUD_002170 [Saccharomycodes ludwigii]
MKISIILSIIALFTRMINAIYLNDTEQTSTMTDLVLTTITLGSNKHTSTPASFSYTPLTTTSFVTDYVTMLLTLNNKKVVSSIYTTVQEKIIVTPVLLSSLASATASPYNEGSTSPITSSLSNNFYFTNTSIILSNSTVDKDVNATLSTSSMNSFYQNATSLS